MSSFSFSKRTQWVMHPNALSSSLEDVQSQNVSILDLTESNPTRCGFQYPSVWLECLSQEQSLVYQPEAKGLIEARLAICQYYHERKLKIPADQLVLTSSTSEGYSFLLKLLTNPGDHVLIPKPSYPLFQFLLELHDVEFDFYPLVYSKGTWKIDRNEFCALMNSRTKAVIVVNPNNPTCSYLDQHDLQFLNKMCADKAAIISDEVFLDYRLNENVQANSLIENKAALTFVLSGISKILGLPQMKLSWIAVNGPVDTVKQAIERLDVIADTYLSVNTPVQLALSQWLPQAGELQKQILERVKHNLQVLRQKNFDVLPVEGGWYAVIKLPPMKSEEQFILDMVNQDHVLIHPGYFFDFPEEGFLIVSLLPKTEIFREAIERISRKIGIL